ncbi:MAG: hypothetical protein AAGF11_01760 [Myxococcota bacterium]
MTTLLDARAKFLSRIDSPPQGESARWIHLELGPIPMVIPNTASRKDTVRFHDLHHVLTGYKTDWAGEFEISAWEVASGCADKSFAWMMNLPGLVGGLCRWPRRTFRAFVRGLRSRNLYRERWGDALLAQSVEATRARLGLHRDGRHATFGEATRFLLWATLAWLWVLAPLALVTLAVVTVAVG